MFESKPELKNYFEKFKNMSLEILYKSDALLNHATNVMEAIDTAVTELDDAEKTIGAKEVAGVINVLYQRYRKHL